MKKNIIAFFLFVFYLFLFSCSGNSIVVSRYNHGIVSLKEAIDMYNILDKNDKLGLKTDDDFFKLTRKIALEEIILSRAEADNLEEEPAVADKILKIKKKVAFEALRKKNSIDSVSVLKSDYNRYKKRYELYQIVRRTDVLDETKIEESKKILKDISGQVKDLDSFKESAREYSEDGTAANGGYIGKVRLGFMEKELDDVISKLGINKVSSVVESSSGLHLFFIAGIDEIDSKELYQDQELYQEILNDKKAAAEEKWYKKLLNDRDLKLDLEIIKEEKFDDAVVVEYKGDVISRKNLFDTVENYKKNSFPAPTHSELEQLVKNMALNLILEKKAMSKSILKSRDFKEYFEKEKDFLLLTEYIDRNAIYSNITEESIRDFYRKNIKTLFTFKLQNGGLYIQPIDEVKDFIVSKLKDEYRQEARYQLYRKIIDEEKFEIDQKGLEKFMKAVGKK